ncbi:subunit of tubulin prefoldin, partial [Spiromyces aspiralis]
MSSTKAEGNTRVVNLDSFSLQQLSQIREQLEQEISQLTSGFTQLKQAQASFRDCKMSLDALKPENKDKPILVPLTESLYVPGTLDDIKSVLVDVGTGYYIEK